MSTDTNSNLTRVSREEVAESLLSSTRPNIAIVDVRDSDHVGGHIKGSTWVSSETIESRMPEILQTLKDKDQVIFHCGLSQQRGPNAALKYAKARQDLDGKSSTNDKKKEQQICVLDGGFSMWQAKYGEDERLTEDYAKDIWKD